MKVSKKEFLKSLEFFIWANLKLPFPPIWADKVKEGVYAIQLGLEQVLELLDVRSWEERYYVYFYLPSPRLDWEQRIKVAKKIYNKIKDKIQFQVTIEEVYNGILPIYCISGVSAYLVDRH